MKIEGVVKLLKAKDDMKSNVTLLMISLCGLMLGVSIFMNILPSNPLLRPNILSQFAPQGFAFYSKILLMILYFFTLAHLKLIYRTRHQVTSLGLVGKGVPRWLNWGQ